MMDLISCYNDHACSTYTTTSSCIIPNLPPSTQTAVCSVYKATLSTGRRHVITLTWYRNDAVQGLHVTADDTSSSPPPFRLNTNSRLFRKKKGNKSFQTKTSRFEVFYDFSEAAYGAGAEPLDGYYVLILVDSEIGLFVGDLPEKLKSHKVIGKFCLSHRKEHFSGNGDYATKARFSGTGILHDIVIRSTREPVGSTLTQTHQVLTVCIDKRVVIRVKRLQWNFRGNQTMFLDGLLVDLMWDVHDWFFESDPRSGSGSGSGHGVFMFRTRSGLDSRLWLEEKSVKREDDNKKEFSLLVYATKS